MRKVKIIGAIGLTLFFSLLFLPAAGAIPWTFDNNVTVQGDLTVNGSFSFPITDNTIVDADINSAAAIDASKIGGGNVSTTEYDYLSEVTSDVQTQLVGKQAGSSRLTNLSSGTIQDNTTIYNDIHLKFGTDNDFTLQYKSASATLVIALDNGDAMCTFSKTGNLACSGEGIFSQLSTSGVDNAYGINVTNTEDPTGANLEAGLFWFNGTSNLVKQRNADNTATIAVNKEMVPIVIKGYTAADDNVVRWKAPSAMTLQELYCDTGGTDNVTVTLYNGSTTTGLVVAATSAGATDSSASAPNVAVDDKLKFSLSSLQGTGTSLACTVTYYNVGN